MNKKLKELEAKVKKLEAENLTLRGGTVALSKSPQANQNISAVTRDDPSMYGFGQNANKAALKAIKVPRVFSHLIVTRYLDQIAKATEEQRSFGHNDYQSYLVKQIPMNYLSTVLKHDDYHVKMYIQYTLPERIREQDRGLVIKYLLKFPDLLTTVASRPNWENAAWPIVVKGLLTEKYLPSAWMQMAVNKNTNQGNLALLKHFESRGTVDTLNYLTRTSLTPQVIEASVERMWQRKKIGMPYEVNYASLCAVQYGHLDALDHLFKFLRSINNDDDYTRKRAKKILANLIDSNMDFLAWYTANKGKIRFNKQRMKYVVL